MTMPDTGSVIEKAFSRERLENWDQRFAHPPYLLERRMHDRIVAGDIEGALALLGETNRNERARLAADRFRSLKNSLIGSCTIYTRAAIEGGVDAELAYTLSDIYIRTIENAREQDDLAGIENRMLRDFVSLVNRYRAVNQDILIMRAARFVRMNLCRAVTLRETAKKLGVSEQYLSAQFTRKTGKTFVAFVQETKVEEAKTFLRTTDHGVMKIALTLGFSSQAYFTRVFTKVTGMSPTNYRRSTWAAR